MKCNWGYLIVMPQLDILSYFASAMFLAIIFIGLLFLMHTYYLPKIAETLKLRNKLKRNTVENSVNETKNTAILNNVNKYLESVVNEIKTNTK